MQNLLQDILLVSFSTSFVIALVLLLSKLFQGRSYFRCKYLIWLLIAVRLLIPISMEQPKAFAPVSQMAGQLILWEGQTTTVQSEAQNNALTGQEVTHGEISFAVSQFSGDALVLLWVLGAGGFLLFHFFGLLLFQMKIKPHLRFMQTIRAKSAIPVYWCDCIMSPMLIGFWKPKILISQNDYTQEELALILKHEMTHYRRGDIWYKLLLVAANAVHFFNPLVYLMVRQATADLEYACDDLVIAGMNAEEKQTYALTILKTMNGGNCP